MVKLGSNLSDKPEKQPLVDDGFDNIPLITSLEVNQLQQLCADKVMVRTTANYQQLQQQKKKTTKRRLYLPGIKKLNINFYDEVSERVKLTGLILITLGFLACLLLLVMYKALWYDQLTCPEGFVLKQKHCSPTGLEMYYTEQRDPGLRSNAPASLYTALGHLAQAKRTAPELASPWLPVINALKEAKKAKEAAGQEAE